MEHLHTWVSESAAFLAERVNDCPQVGIILGSGPSGIGALLGGARRVG